MDKFGQIIADIDEFVWGIPLIVLILGVGIYLTFRLVFLPLKRLPRAFRYMFAKEKGGKGEVSSFGALCTALSATIGTGNIVGVATAIVAGGPGAMFWMWLAAFFGMATKFAEGVLAVRYRKVYRDGHALGGPFYYIERGLGPKFKWLAVLFAVFGMCVGLFGIGTFTQVNSISSAVNEIIPSSTVSFLGGEFTVSTIVSGAILTVIVALVLIGGVKRIAKVSEMVVPFMAIIYILFGLIVIFTNVTALPEAFRQIFVGAFNPRAVAGGAAGSILVAMQMRICRAQFPSAWQHTGCHADGNCARHILQRSGAGFRAHSRGGGVHARAGKTGACIHDGHVYRYAHRMHDDGTYHYHNGKLEHRTGRRGSYDNRVFAGTARFSG